MAVAEAAHPATIAAPAPKKTTNVVAGQRPEAAPAEEPPAAAAGSETAAGTAVSKPASTAKAKPASASVTARPTAPVAGVPAPAQAAVAPTGNPPPHTAGPKEHAAAPAEGPLAAREAAAATEHAPATTPALPGSTSAATATDKPSDKDIAREAWRRNLPDISSSEDTKASILIPIKGSIEGATYHINTKPKSVVVNLPKAESLITMRFYKIKRDGFRNLWILKQEEGDGTTVKLMLGEATAPQVEIKDEFVRINVRKPVDLPPEE
jgi:hypothetical protein